ncbi:hypothetical protein C8Q80DRAFT_208762 [Daedaleopsis nitida]|nr:hypothetical protein C8Q80DRAFT_208762 [Daedaleopsis nitida]
MRDASHNALGTTVLPCCCFPFAFKSHNVPAQRLLRRPSLPIRLAVAGVNYLRHRLSLCTQFAKNHTCARQELWERCNAWRTLYAYALIDSRTTSERAHTLSGLVQHTLSSLASHDPSRRPDLGFCTLSRAPDYPRAITARNSAYAASAPRIHLAFLCWLRPARCSPLLFRGRVHLPVYASFDDAPIVRSADPIRTKSSTNVPCLRVRLRFSLPRLQSTLLICT